MTYTPTFSDRETYNDLLDELVDAVIEALGDPDADPALTLNDHHKYDIIEAFLYTDAFKKAMDGFYVYGDNDRLIPADWDDIASRARESGGPAAYRKHAERLAYYEVRDHLKNDPRVAT